MKETKWHLDWKGDVVEEKFAKASKRAIDDTLDAAVKNAKQLVRKRSGVLARSIQKEEAAVDKKGELVGRFGSSWSYALVQELGARGSSRRWRFRPYLRPSADQEFPAVTERLKRYAK